MTKSQKYKLFWKQNNTTLKAHEEHVAKLLQN